MRDRRIKNLRLGLAMAKYRWCHQAQRPEFYSYEPYDRRREVTPTNCPLSPHMLCSRFISGTFKRNFKKFNTTFHYTASFRTAWVGWCYLQTHKIKQRQKDTTDINSTWMFETSIVSPNCNLGWPLETAVWDECTGWRMKTKQHDPLRILAKQKLMLIPGFKNTFNNW